MEKKGWPWKRKSSLLLAAPGINNNNNNNSSSSSNKGLLCSSPLASSVPSPSSPASALFSNTSIADNNNNNNSIISNNAAATAAAAHQELAAQLADYEHALELSTQKLHNAEERVAVLTEKLSVALSDVAEKEELLKQQTKMTSYAVSGRGKAESEVGSLKQQLEEVSKQRATAEGQVAHLDAVLKECMRQNRQIREEQEHKTQELISESNREWEKIKAEMESNCTNLERQLLASEAENKAMSKSLQERAKAIVDVNESKVKAETEVKLLQVKVGSLEKDISAFKYEIRLLNKEVEIRNEEKMQSKKAADAAHKQHMENVKKIAKLEAECQRLKVLLRKRLPGPAALAQMKMEVDSFGRDGGGGGDGRIRRKSLPPSGGFRSISTTNTAAGSLAMMQQHDTAMKEMEALSERLFAMDEETKLLKEVLAKRTTDLQGARQLCARMATKLSILEQQLQQQDAPKDSSSSFLPSIANGLDILPEELLLLSEPSMASRSDDTSNEDEEAESWASALIAELAVFKKEIEPVHSKDVVVVVDRDKNIDKNIDETIDEKIDENIDEKIDESIDEKIDVVKDTITTTSMLRVVDILPQVTQKCKGIKDKLSLIREYLKEWKAENNIETLPTQVQESIGIAMDASEEVIVLEKALLDGLPKWNKLATDSLFNNIPLDSIPNLGLVTYKIVRMFEDLVSSLEPQIVSKKNSSITETPNEEEEDNEMRKSDGEVLMQLKNLLSSKEQVLQGKSSVMEFLLRLALLMCHLAGLDSSELDVVHSKLIESEKEPNSESELELIKKEKEELDATLAATSAQLELVKDQLAESEKLVSSLQDELCSLKESRDKLGEDMKSLVKRAEEEACQLREKMESLEEELKQLKKKHDEAEVKCEDLQQQLLQQGFSTPSKYVVETRESNRRSDEGEARIKKEKEVIAAREKLAECQRSILVLGEQLKAIDSPSEVSSLLGCESMDSTETRIVVPVSGHANRHSYPLSKEQIWRKEHYHQQQQWSPSIEYSPGNSNRANNHNNHSHHPNNNHNSSNYKRSSQTPSKNPPVPLFSMLREDSYDDNDNDDDNYNASELATRSYGSLPDSGLISPTLSPVQFPASNNRRTDHAEAVRMDLTKNMNRLAVNRNNNTNTNTNTHNKSSENNDDSKVGKSSGSGGLGRLFSRNKHSR